MISIRGLTIEVSQNDHLSIRPSFGSYTLQEGDVVTVAILSNPPIRISQTNTGYNFVVFNFPTNIPVGEYLYDISIKFADNKTQTLNWLQTGNFNVRRTAR